MAKITKVILITLGFLFVHNNANAEIQLAYRGPFALRANSIDYSWMIGFGPLFKNRLNNELYLSARVGLTEKYAYIYDYYDPTTWCAEAQMVSDKNDHWAIGPIAGIYRIGKKNYRKVDTNYRKLIFYNQMISGGAGLFVRLHTKSDFYFVTKGVISYAFATSSEFPIDLNANANDMDYYTSSKYPVYNKEFKNKMVQYEKEQGFYAVPCILSISVHRYLNYLSCAAGIETVIIPYFPQDGGLYNGVHYKLSGYVSLGIRILKKRNGALPFLF